ncbi:MAG: hypothetical protein IJE62_00360 [Clostridia bacterium]|nr:hypothetical protein [Clostridia bacterium]
MLEFNVKNQIIERTDNFKVVADSRNYLTAKFSFSEEWEEDVTAIFGYENEYYNVILADGLCHIPWEVIKVPFFTVSLVCGDRITANTVRVDVLQSGYTEGKIPQEPTPDVYQQILSRAKAPYIGENGNWFEWDKDKAAHTDTGVKAEGEKGEQGIQGERGPQGEKGDTPTPDVAGEIPEPLAVNTIYDLGTQRSLTLNLPPGKISDFVEVDFLSDETPTTLVITSANGLSEYDFVPRSNMIYSLYFDWGVLYFDRGSSEYVYGWRFAYAEYVASEV